MKTPLLITAMTFFFALYANANVLQGSFPFGSKEKIIKVRELPDISEFQLKDGTYYDIGSLYTKRQFLWLGYSYGEPQYVGFMDSQDKYVPLTAQDLNEVAGLGRIQLPASPSISFFDSYISRPLLVVILVLSFYYGRRFYILRKKIILARLEEEVSSWPPPSMLE